MRALVLLNLLNELGKNIVPLTRHIMFNLGDTYLLKTQKKTKNQLLNLTYIYYVCFNAVNALKPFDVSK